MSVIEQVEILNHAANTALTLAPLWAALYLGLHVALRGNKSQPQPVPAQAPVTPGPLVSSLRANRVTPAPKPVIPEPEPQPEPVARKRRATRKPKAKA